jgi:TRAP-type C4-dicarboxylate transport system permease small subunit
VKVIKWFDQNIEKLICSILLALMTLIIVAQLILRWTGLPLAWTEEIARYLFVWLIYIACSYGIKERKHIKVEIILLLFEGKAKYIFQQISNILFFIFCTVLTYFGALLLKKISLQGQVSPAVQIPMILPYASFVVGAILMMVRLLQDSILLHKEEKQRIQDLDKGVEA